MLILDETNSILDTDVISERCYFSVLRFKDPKNPDFFFDSLDHIEEFSSYSTKLSIGPYEMFAPLHWSILCSDMEYVQTIPLAEFSGRDFYAFCLNPIDGYMPEYHKVRIVEIYSNNTWSSPPVQDKDMLVVPIGKNQKSVERGPACTILSPHRLDISKPLSDIL